MSSENGWIPWNERNDIPKRAFLIGWEVIPMPPVPDEYLEDFKNSINQSLIGKSRCWFGREDYNSNDSFKIVLYNQLSRDEQIAFSAYETSSFYYPNQTNIDYLRSVAVTIEKLAQNDFEDKLKTSACQDSASAPNASDLPAAPAPVPSDNDSPEDNKTVKPEMTQKKKGGRPTKEQEERICIAIIELFDSPKKSQIINSIKTLGDAVKKINRLLRESGIQIDERRLDGDKKPGRLFRYLWYFHTKIFRWGYREQNLEMDKDLIKEYRTKYKKYQDYLEK